MTTWICEEDMDRLVSWLDRSRGPRLRMEAASLDGDFLFGGSLIAEGGAIRFETDRCLGPDPDRPRVQWEYDKVSATLEADNGLRKIRLDGPDCKETIIDALFLEGSA